MEQQINIIKGESYRLQLFVGMRNSLGVMRTLESFYKDPGWEPSGLDLHVGRGRERDLDDTTKRISKVLGEESVRRHEDEPEAILKFATWWL